MRDFIISLSAVLVIFLSHNLLAQPGPKAEDKFAHCSQYRGESECAGSGFCSWDLGRQMCQPGYHAAVNDSCRQITCPCQCKPAIGCQWDATARRCEPLG